MRKYPFAREPTKFLVDASKPVDFNRGPSELAEAIGTIDHAGCRLVWACMWWSSIEALQYPERFGGKRTITSRFDPIEPLQWTA